MDQRTWTEELETAERTSPWARGEFTRPELADALLVGKVAGPVTSHDRRNVRWKIDRLVEGDPDLQFGITGLAGLTAEQVLALVADAAGFDPDPLLLEGPTAIDPWKVLEACEAAGRRLAQAADRGEHVLLATGHPAGLPLLYMATGRLLEEHGAKLLRPLAGFDWREEGRHRQIRYLRGVAVLTDRGSTIHSHAPGPMQRMLQEVRPDLVFADHGFAGAAIEAGIDTISIADVNDPAPVVARHQGRNDVVIVMDDNVQPEDYWPCFQAIAAQFP
jgi:Phosphatase